MGIFDSKLNPFKSRQGGAANTGVKGKGETLSKKEANNIVKDVHAMLRNNPNLSDAELMRVLNCPDENNYQAAVATGRRAYEKENLLKPDKNTNNNVAPPVQTQNGSPGLEHIDKNSELNLVNYSADQLVQHVDRELNRVQFGWSFNTKVMENFGEIWALVGPAILLIGTIGEVFLVLWLRQKVQDTIAGLSIVAVAMVLEGTFLAISYKAATIRGRAERRDTGPNDLDRRKLRRQRFFWFALAAGVCVTQIIFVAAQTRADGIGEAGVWIFAIVRAIFTLVADGYTAFAHEEKPTTADQALEEQQQRTKQATALLAQKRVEITSINDGILSVREAHTEAEMKDDKMQTRLTIEKMQNQAQIGALKSQQEMANMTILMLTSLQRAMIDPTMGADKRKSAIDAMNAMAQAQLPPEKVKERIITEETTREEDV